MSETTKSRNVLAIAAATVATGVLAYLIYFDYKRRNDAEFRRQLRKEKKRVSKNVAKEEQQSSASGGATPSSNITPEILRAALEQVKNEELPTTNEEKETYFMSQVGMGEQLASQGQDFYLPAAIAFYKALRVYPSPLELIVIYQKTVPESLFKVIIDLTNLDVVVRASGYYDHFPPRSMNVEIKSNENGRKVLLVTKDVAAGETIYKEYPVVAVLDVDLESVGKYCSHCFRSLSSSTSVIQLPEDSNPLKSTYCSSECLTTSKAQSTSLLFTQESPLPPELAPPSDPAIAGQERKAAQDNFIAYLQKQKEEGMQRSAPLLVARFIARQIALETAKLAGKVTKSNSTQQQTEQERKDYTDADKEGYLLADHIERLRYLEIKTKDEEKPLISTVLEKTLPGLEQFVTEERHATLLGKMAYNAIGVGCRDDKPAPTSRPEDVEKTRTHFGTNKQIGSAFYTLSSYANHSCKPTAKWSFPAGTTELHVIASQNLKKGDEVTVAYVDVEQHETETPIEARRRRRIELARGWRFACGCVKCEEERKGLSVDEKEKEEEKGGIGIEDGKDESRIEDSARRFEEREKELGSERAGGVE